MRTPPRSFSEGAGPRPGPWSPQFPKTGATIDYYLPDAPQGEVTLEVLDGSGKTIRKFSSVGSARAEHSTESDAGESDEEEGPRRTPPPILEKTAGMHRFTWDLRYPGPWQSEKRPEGSNGPVAVPGRYSVRLTAGAWTGTQPLTITEDPRITKDGVTTADLREQFEQNVRACALVSEVNKAVARLRAAESSLRGDSANADKLSKLDALASHLITPPIRYSKPELQTHIAYLYTLTNNTDQKIGQDAKDRYAALRKELDARVAELNSILGPATPQALN